MNNKKDLLNEATHLIERLLECLTNGDAWGKLLHFPEKPNFIEKAHYDLELLHCQIVHYINTSATLELKIQLDLLNHKTEESARQLESMLNGGES